MNQLVHLWTADNGMNEDDIKATYGTTGLGIYQLRYFVCRICLYRTLRSQALSIRFGSAIRTIVGLRGSCKTSYRCVEPNGASCVARGCPSLTVCCVPRRAGVHDEQHAAGHTHGRRD